MNKTVRSLLAWGGLVLAADAMAQALPSGVGLYMELGQTRHHGEQTDGLTLGARVPTNVALLDGQLTLAIDAYVSRWRAQSWPGERTTFTQLGLVPMVRWRWDGGRSPWFIEGGVGASYLANGYQTKTKVFGSRWNFSDHLGFGVNFGENRRHEIGVYVKHVSNAGLKKPNPGETFYMLRYGYVL
jgi:lipid A 3-O-deacylase